MIRGKRGMEPITVALIIIAVIAGLFVADKAGFFSVFTPNVGQPSGTDSLVNKYYYGPATNVLSFSCTNKQNVILRLTFPDSSILPSAGNQIAVNEGGTSLVAYTVPSSSGSSSGSADVYCTQRGAIIQSLGTLKITRESTGNYYVCAERPADSSHNNHQWIEYKKFTSGGTLPTTTDVVGSPYVEYYSGQLTPIDEWKYACSSGNIIKKHCTDTGGAEELVEQCALGCTFLGSQQVPEGIADVVKCNGNYKPGQKMCVGTGLFSTSTDGNSISSQICGYQCANNLCIDCQDGNKRCAQLPATTTNIEICAGGHWQQWNDASATCIGLQQCAEQGTSASCSTTFVEGQERCSGKQPQVFRVSDAQWHNNGDSCDLACTMSGATATCQKQCDPTGYSCAGGVLYNCLASDRDNELSNLGTCVSGTCTADNSKCSSVRQIGDKYCSSGNVFAAVNSGNQYDLFGGVSGQIFGSPCQNGCEPVGTNDAKCTKIAGCDGKGGLAICVGSVKKVCSIDEQSYTSSEDCSQTLTNGFCEVMNNAARCSKPADACTGVSICTSNSIRACNSGTIGDIINNCNGLGCITATNGLAQCNDECSALDSYQCKLGGSYKCVLNGTQKILSHFQDCGSQGCDTATGRCKTQCSGTKSCVSGKIYACTAQGLLGDVIDSCAGLGCDEANIACVNQCSVEGTSRCSGQDEIDCVKNLTNNQLLERSIPCGMDGCNAATKHCYASNPNSLVCKSSLMYETDNSGLVLPTLLHDCDTEPMVNGLQPYCSEGLILSNPGKVCKICEQGNLICGNKELYQCADPFTGQKANVRTCEAGCLTVDSGSGRNYVCDNLAVSLSSTQNFFADEKIVIQATISGDKSLSPLVSKSFSARILGQGVDQTVTGTSDTNGKIYADFGLRALGDYNITITFDGFTGTNSVVNVKSRVTKDYKIEIIGQPVAIKIPGETPSLQVRAEDANGNAPDSVVISTQPSGLTLSIKPGSAAGLYTLETTGDPGIYTVGLKAVKGGTALDEQTLNIEIRKPILEIRTNLPTSSIKGKKSWDITVLGASKEVKPDTITATISHSPAETLTLHELGAGRYTFDYEIKDLGTYTLTATAAKDGYEPAQFSQQVQISNSGDATAPTQSSGTQEDQTTTGTTGSSAGGGASSSSLIYVAVGLVLAYIFFGRKKR